MQCTVVENSTLNYRKLLSIAHTARCIVLNNTTLLNIALQCAEV